MQRTLELHCYRVVGAAADFEAVAAFDARPGAFTAIATDIMMPRLNRLAALRTIFQKHARVPVIATSGFTDLVDHTELARERIEFLHKPYTVEQLLNLLHHALTRPANATPPATHPANS